MKQYIDKTSLVEALNKNIKSITRLLDLSKEKDLDIHLLAKVHAYEDMLDFVNALEVKEVDVHCISSCLGQECDYIELSELDKLMREEKQGEQTSLPQFTFDDVLALQCCMETAKKVQEDKELYKALSILHGKVYDAYHLEKQGKAKEI